MTGSGARRVRPSASRGGRSGPRATPRATATGPIGEILERATDRVSEVTDVDDVDDTDAQMGAVTGDRSVNNRRFSGCTR
jgi:hypothetical protein